MTGAVRAELRKLRTSRSLVAIPVVAVAVSVAAATVLVTALDESEIAARLSDHGPLRFGPTNVGLLLLLFGVRVFADEPHHRTLASTYLSTPDRKAVLRAKAVVTAGASVATCIAIDVLVLPITLIALDRRGIPMSVDVAATAALLGRATLAMTLVAVLGLAVGALARNRTAALVGCTAWLALVEDLVGALLRIRELVPGALVRGLVSGAGPDTVGAVPAACLLVALVVTAAGGAAVLSRRDVP